MTDIVEVQLAELKSLFEEIDQQEPGSSEVEELLKDVNSTIQQVKIQLHGVTNQQKKDAFLVQVSEYEAKARNAKKSVLLAGGSKAKQGQTQVDRDSAEQAREDLETLQKAHNQLLESEANGQNVLKNLAHQKETIANANKNLKETNQHLSYSKKLINGMSQWWR